jgi:branched-chain amino acid transport system permease protein
VAELFQTLIAVVVIGSLYALIALGYTMVYGILKFINFAHSDVFVLGAWLSFTIGTLLISRLGLDPAAVPWWLGPIVLVGAMVLAAGVGFIVERFAYRPLRKAPRLNVLITAIGVSLFLQNTGQLQFTIAPDLKLPFGTRPQRMPSLLPERALNDSTIARGISPKAPAGVADGTAFRLEAPITLERGRAFRLEVVTADGREHFCGVLNPLMGTGSEGEMTREVTAIEPLPPLSAAEAAGARYRLIRAAAVPIQLVDLAIVGSALVLMLGLEILVFRTKVGRAMRAVSFNVETASLMGINVDRVISFTFCLGAALAAAAGFLNVLKYPGGLNIPAHETWVLLGLKAFVAAVVGGIGNIRGAVLGGFLIAGVEQGGIYLVYNFIDLRLGTKMGTNLRDVYVFAVLILALLFRPSGLLGSTVREKV